MTLQRLHIKNALDVPSDAFLLSLPHAQHRLVVVEEDGTQSWLLPIPCSSAIRKQSSTYETSKTDEMATLVAYFCSTYSRYGALMSPVNFGGRWPFPHEQRGNLPSSRPPGIGIPPFDRYSDDSSLCFQVLHRSAQGTQNLFPQLEFSIRHIDMAQFLFYLKSSQKLLKLVISHHVMSQWKSCGVEDDCVVGEVKFEG